MIKRICIFTAQEDQVLPVMCLTTARHHHPHAEILHLTDSTTPQLVGSDGVRREKWDGVRDHIPLVRARLLARLDNRETLLLDSDTLICASLDEVFDEPFDVALTYREGSKVSRFNSGVMFSRRVDFWRAFLDKLLSGKRWQTWNEEQVALDQVALSGEWAVRELPCTEWNCSDLDGDEIPEARVLHYKGKRKAKMAEHYIDGVWQRAYATS